MEEIHWKEAGNVQSLSQRRSWTARENVRKCVCLCICVLACAHVCVYSVSVYTYMHMLRFVHGHAHEPDDRSGEAECVCLWKLQSNVMLMYNLPAPAICVDNREIYMIIMNYYLL